MRIALNAWFLDQPATGSGQYLTHLLGSFAADHSDHVFLLCAPALHASLAVQFSPPLFEWRLLRTPFDGRSNRLSKLWFEQLSVPRASHRWGADLLHTPYWASPCFSPIPTVVTIHDLIPAILPAYRGGILGRAYNALVAYSARRASWALTDSWAARRDILQHLHLAPERVTAIHLAAQKGFAPVRDSTVLEQVRLKYDLPPRYLLSGLGGFDVRKNVSGILRAFASLEMDEIRLVVAGQLPKEDSPFFPNPERMAAELGIRDRVCFTGWIDEEDKPALYSGAVAFLFPSLYEGFGLPPLEAMSCGTPVITSDRSALPEVVGPGGICIDPENTAALTHAMRSLLERPTLRKQLQEAAMARAKQFSWQRCARETMSVYERVGGVLASA